MSKKKKVEEEVVPENMVQLNLTSVLAAIVKNMGVVAVPMSAVLEDYSSYNLAVSLDDETNMLILELIEESSVEVESDES